MSALASRVRGTLHRMKARLDTRAVILLYHRVADDPTDPYLLCVTPAHFDEQLQAVREVAQPLPLHELARLHRAGRLPRRAVGISFDDGYQDNLYTARPLLERHDVPATVFMTTGEVGRRREFWWDELQHILLGAHPLPAQLDITLDGAELRFDLADTAAAGQPIRWTFADDATPTPRHTAFRALYDRMRGMPTSAQRTVLDRLIVWAGMSPIVHPTHRALEPDETLRLAEGGIVEIGAHTMNHPALSEQTVDVQRDEITRSRAALRDVLGYDVAGFAYPYGMYSADSVRIVRDAGFDYACACIGHPVLRRSRSFELPRIDVGDVDGDALARQLRWAFGD